MRLWLRTEQLREQAAFGIQALDAVEHAVLALDRSGRLLFANRYGEALLRAATPLAVKQGALTAAEHGDAQRLAAGVKACWESGRATSFRAGQGATPPNEPVTVTVLAVPRAGRMESAWGAAELLVLVTLSRHRRWLTVSQLMQIFQLTRAEARLARALAGGESLASYARSEGVAMSTVRTQLTAVFQKTGTRRQADLVRLLVPIPATRDTGR